MHTCNNLLIWTQKIFLEFHLSYMSEFSVVLGAIKLYKSKILNKILDIVHFFFFVTAHDPLQSPSSNKLIFLFSVTSQMWHLFLEFSISISLSHSFQSVLIRFVDSFWANIYTWNITWPFPWGRQSHSNMRTFPVSNQNLNIFELICNWIFPSLVSLR